MRKFELAVKTVFAFIGWYLLIAFPLEMIAPGLLGSPNGAGGVLMILGFAFYMARRFFKARSQPVTVRQ